MKKRVHAYWVLLGFLLLPGVARAGEWRVTPIRLVFDRGAKSGVVTVSNEGDEKIELQMSASVWTQDAEGKDRYAETNDLVFFPKIMTIESKQERILRAGIRIPATKREKTYRLFIEEIPGPRKGKGGNVFLAIRFGLPVFVRGRSVGGEPVFSRELSGWYLLAEASRRYSTEVPREVCPDLARITLNVKTDLFSLSG